MTPAPAKPKAATRRAAALDYLTFEHYTQPVLPAQAFLLRLVRSASIGVAMMLVSLGVGMLGYHALEGLPWIDSFLEAAMLMGGMGPVSTPHSNGGKLFAGAYALYCGLVLILVAGILLAPIAHRILHKFRADPPDS